MAALCASVVRKRTFPLVHNALRTLTQGNVLSLTIFFQKLLDTALVLVAICHAQCLTLVKDRAACIDRIREIGLNAFAEEMADGKFVTIRKASWNPFDW